MDKTFVLSVGGSLLVTKNGIETKFLKEFRNFILRQAKKGRRFYLIVGGGVTARQYIQAALKIGPIRQADRDWVGISATRLNAQLVRAAFGLAAHPEVIINPEGRIKSTHKIIVAGGYKPGWSTDYVAVLIARAHKIKKVINLSNIDYAYDCDPKKFSQAKKLINVSWPEFRKIVGNKWLPGLNLPFDPIASRAAAQNKCQVVILNGQRLKNLELCLDGQKFQGTTIGN